MTYKTTFPCLKYIFTKIVEKGVCKMQERESISEQINHHC